jgi:hypothetical protein
VFVNESALALEARLKPILLLIPLLLIASAPANAPAADLKSILGAEPQDKFNLINVRALAKLMTGEQRVYIYDANPPDVRSREGVIPGAKLLASSGKYDIGATLPADKNARLVFYCHNLH